MDWAASTAWVLHIVVVILAIVQVGAANNDEHARRVLMPGKSNFIGIDCGIAEGTHYDDDATDYRYTSDEKFVNSGTNSEISKDFMSDGLWRQLTNVRSFPEGNNNCYTLKPSQAGVNKYLIRALFMYGNYDSINQPPEFALFVDVNKWGDVKFVDASDVVIKEIIHKPATDYIHVCLVNTGLGTPFISALELIQLNNSIYDVDAGSLVLFRRLDVGMVSSTQRFIRYNDDFYGRIWEPHTYADWQPISAEATYGSFEENDFRPSPTVMKTAVKPLIEGRPLEFQNSAGPNHHFYLYMHFLEVENLQPNDTRGFTIFLNDVEWADPVYPEAWPTTVLSTTSVSDMKLRFRIEATNDSTLPPILNAYEYYYVVNEHRQLPSSQSDVEAIIDIKNTYNIKKNWQGDPCIPEDFRWDGVQCSNNDQNGSRIISLNLSSSGLTNEITPIFSRLTSLESLDLSNNSLTGTIPGFLADMQSLSNLNLSWDKLKGSVPYSLIERRNAGSLILSVEGNPDLCLSASCAKEDKRIKPVILVVIVLLSFFVLLVLTAIIWKCRRKRLGQEGSLRFKSQIFTYPEIISITNNLEEIIGKGGSATVYLGYLGDTSKVAVKVLNPSYVHSLKGFEAEVQLLMRIHHKNLVSLVGYCSEGINMVLIYEYMSEGNLKEHLSEKTKNVLSWKERLQIALDIAQGLEYLHNGCKPPIIHRDMKTANILLNEKLQAKIADFGLSRILATEGDTHVSTCVAGTHGYLDPEYFTSSRLNGKSDVYSFGIILLELITGQPAIIKNDSENIHIVTWVNSKIEEGDIHEVMDPRLRAEFNVNSARKVYETAKSCIPLPATQRLGMSDVLMELKESLAIEMGHQRIGVIGNEDTNPSLSLEGDYDSEMSPYAR